MGSGPRACEVSTLPTEPSLQNHYLNREILKAHTQRKGSDPSSTSSHLTVCVLCSLVLFPAITFRPWKQPSAITIVHVPDPGGSFPSTFSPPVCTSPLRCLSSKSISHRHLPRDAIGGDRFLKHSTQRVCLFTSRAVLESCLGSPPGCSVTGQG